MRKIIIASSILLLVGVWFSCGKKAADDSTDPSTAADGEDDGEDDGGDTTGTLAISESNPLVASFPYELQVTSPTAVTGDTVSQTGTIAVELTSEDEETYVEKVEAAIAVVTAEDPADCLPDLDFTPKENPACYAQTVTADGVGNSVTSDLVSFAPYVEAGRVGSEQSDPMAQRILDDAAGIVAEEEDGEPCVSHVSNYIVDKTANSVNQAQKIVGSLLCVAKVQGKASDLPEKDSTLDLTADAKEVWGSDSLTVKRAEISRVADKDSNPVYRTIVSVIRKASNGDETKLLVDLTNIPDAEEDGSYAGRLMIYDQRRENGVTTPVIISLQYDKSEDLMKFVSREVSMSYDVDPKTLLEADTGMIDFTKVAALGEENSARGPSLTQFAIDTTNGVGTMAQVMSPALHSEEVANAFIVTTKINDDGEVEGCGISGHTLSFVTSANALQSETVTIHGKHCMKNQDSSSGPNYGSNLDASGYEDFAYVQMQCFTGAAGEAEATTSKLTYAVAEKCGMEDSTLTADLATLAVGKAAIAMPGLPTDINVAYDDDVTYDLDLD